MACAVCRFDDHRESQTYTDPFSSDCRTMRVNDDTPLAVGPLEVSMALTHTDTIGCVRSLPSACRSGLLGTRLPMQRTFVWSALDPL